MNEEGKKAIKRIEDIFSYTNNKCILYSGKDVKAENAGCYVGIDKNNKQKILGGVLSERE